MEDQKPWPGVGIGTRSRRGLKQIPKVRKCLNWETCLSKDVYCNSNVSQTVVWRRSPQPLGGFLKFFEKIAILIPLDHISHVFKTISK